MAKQTTSRKISKAISKASKFGQTKKGTYICQICGKEAKNSVDAVTHYLDHGSSALEAVNALIKDQKSGRVTKEDKEAE